MGQMDRLRCLDAQDSRSVPRKLALKNVARLVKIGLAAGLICAGLYAVISGRGYITSDNAVVSAYTVSVRVPVAGRLSGIGVRVGDTVRSGAVLARVDDERINDQRLVDLRHLVTRSNAERAAYAHEIEILIGQRDGLLRRATDHGVASSDYRDRQVEEMARTLDSKVARREQARRDLARKSSLTRDGYASVAETERLHTEYDVTTLEAGAQEVKLGYVRAQAQASRAGVFLENGSNDVAYSTQRADEVSIRIAEAERAMASYAAAGDEAQVRLASEEHRIALLRGADLIAPVEGVVWKLGASDGELLAIGDMVAELVDCRSAFVIVSIPQHRFSDVVTGAEARFRLSGEKTERTGRVLGVTGETSLANDRHLAAAPVVQAAATATVRMELTPAGADAGSGACAVGRTARVLLPASAGSLLPTWVSRLLP